MFNWGSIAGTVAKTVEYLAATREMSIGIKMKVRAMGLELKGFRAETQKQSNIKIEHNATIIEQRAVLIEQGTALIAQL